MGKLWLYCIKLYTFFMEVNIFWTKVTHALGVATVRRWKNSITPDVKDLIFEMCDLAIFEKKFFFCQSENVTLSFSLEKKYWTGWVKSWKVFHLLKIYKSGALGIYFNYIIFFVFGNVLLVLVPPPFFFEQCVFHFYFLKYLFENENALYN